MMFLALSIWWAKVGEATFDDEHILVLYQNNVQEVKGLWVLALRTWWFLRQQS